MSHETPTHADAPTRSDSLPSPSTGTLRRRLRAFRHLRPRQALLLAALVALAAVVAVAPAALTATLALFAATVALLVVTPYAAVRIVAGTA